MRSLRWWHVAVLGTAVVLTVLLLILRAPGIHLAGALGSMALLVVGWFVLGRRAHSDPRFAFSLVTVIIVCCCAGTAFFPTFAIVQCVAFPMIWYFAGSLRAALVANILLEIGVGIGFTISTGTDAADLEQTGITCAVSLGLSLALGLWFSRVYNEIDERQRLIDQLEAAQAQLANLSRDAGAAGERERLAREIHDTIAQDLAGLVLTAQRGIRELGAGNTDATEKQLTILEENARNALAETRALVASGAAVGVDGGLSAALHRLGDRFERETGIAVTVTVDETAALDRDGEVVLLRCAQEALANIRKHSAAGTATLTLSKQAETVELSIADDGTGFDPGTSRGGFGLDGMRERLGFVHGSLAVDAKPGAGTTLVVSLPSAQAVAS